MSPVDIDEFFRQTLCGAYADEALWQAVHALRRFGTREIFEKAAEWCESDDPLATARGADVLARLGRTVEHSSNKFPEKSYPVMAGLAPRDTELRPLAAAIAALGHLGNPLAVPVIAGFHSHRSAEVRYDVAFALGCFPNEALSVFDSPQVNAGTDEDVRGWAIFGLGVLGDCESAEIRDAFVRTLSDSDDDVREEAAVALCKEKGPAGALSPLTWLERPEVTSRAVAAAYLLLGMRANARVGRAADCCAALREGFAAGS
jgi:HEAT repeat protein